MIGQFFAAYDSIVGTVHLDTVRLLTAIHWCLEFFSWINQSNIFILN